MSITVPISASPIRKLNVRHDLLAVADLIELCFASTIDADGREYLRHLRWAARDVNYLNWLQSAGERLAAPLFGFVWEEDRRIVGNLSLIPMMRGGKMTYWIANVAVHPNYRQRGIGRELTSKALAYLRERGIRTAWLQVRDDNPVAYRLYLSLGFVERLRRTTWQTQPNMPIPRIANGAVKVENRQGQHWSLQYQWLQAMYPQELTWSMSVNFSQFSPGFLQNMWRWLQGKQQENWMACRDGQPVGFASWEPSRSYCDPVWLAVPPEYEEAALLPLLIHTRHALDYRGRPLQVNYPADRAAQLFDKAGFYHHQTLVWMSVALSHTA